MLHIDKNSKRALYMQLYVELKEQIISSYKIGQKLPSIRKISSEYSVSKTTVESAYSQLYAEGYIESKEKVGYFVSENIIELEHFSASKEEPLHVEKKETLHYDFYPARLTNDAFPLKIFNRMFIKAMKEPLDFGAYINGAGEEGLREEIAKYLQSSRGVTCRANQIIVCGGFADSMALLSELVKPKYTRIAMEYPGYMVALNTFKAHGLDVKKIGVDENGLEIENLEKSEAKLVYITPSHQYPTGVIMPIANRLRLLTWAKKVQGYIIEDDYDSELNYKIRPIPSLQGLDNDERVVYVGTFSKSLSPALRVSYMLLPKALLEKYTASYFVHFARVSLPIQKSLEFFMKEGHYDRHIRKIRTLNRKKHDEMILSIKEIFNEEMTIIKEGGGLNILMRPTCEINVKNFRDKAKKEGIKLYLASDFYGDEYEAIRMGFGGLELNEIRDSIIALKKVWDFL